MVVLCPGFAGLTIFSASPAPALTVQTRLPTLMMSRDDLLWTLAPPRDWKRGVSSVTAVLGHSGGNGGIEKQTGPDQAALPNSPSA